METVLVPTKLVETAVPTNLSERHIGVPIEYQSVKGGGLLYGGLTLPGAGF